MSTIAVVAVSPADRTGDVSTTPSIVVTFDTDVQVGIGAPPYLTEVGTQVVVPVNTPEADGRTLSFTPTTALEQNALYTIILPSTSVTGILGGVLSSPFIWTFTTGESSELGVPTLNAPAAYSYVEAGALEVILTEVTGAENYEVQLSTSRAFDTVISRVLEHDEDPDTLQLSTGILDDEDLVAGKYFIRARAYTDSQTSAWSTNIEVTYALQVDIVNEVPEYGPTWALPAASFILTAVDPPAKSNRTPSRVIFQFSQAIASPFTQYPTVTTTDMYYGTMTDLAITESEWVLSGDGKTLTWTPATTLASNTAYTFQFPQTFVDAAGHLFYQEAADYSFTTAYAVMYTGPRQLRLRLGEVVADLPDEELSYWAFLGSVETNLTHLGGQPNSSELMQPLSSIGPDVVTEAMLRASIYLLQHLLIEITRYGDTQLRLGDFSTTYNYNNAGVLENLLHELEVQLSRYATPGACVKSSDWLDGMLDGPRAVRRSNTNSPLIPRTPWPSF